MPFSTAPHLSAVTVNSTVFAGSEGTIDIWYEDWNTNGVFDGGELYWPVVSNEPDSDGDGLLDGRENAWGTSAGNPDSDYDGITDGDEIDVLGGPSAGYNPLSWDTDSDGYGDRDEFYSFYGVNYLTEGNGSSYYDWDGDGTANPQDSHPLVYVLYNDWNYDGLEDHIAYHQDNDNDGRNDSDDSHPYDFGLWCDWNYNGYNDDAEPPSDPDGDGVAGSADSHPMDPNLWNDLNHNGYNDDAEPDADGDGHYDYADSHPYDSGLWCDWNYNSYNDDAEPPQDSDGDGYSDYLDSHPADPNLWNDLNQNGYNDDAEPDADGDNHYDYADSHPYDSGLWCDWNYNSYNDNAEPDADGDGHYDYADSHPYDSGLWCDWNYNSYNDDAEPPQDSDGDSYNDSVDSHPYDPAYWDDWNNNYISDSLEQDSDGDTVADYLDSHPNDPTLWNDLNFNNINDELEIDSDGDSYADSVDSHPNESYFWSDWDFDGYNSENESDPLNGDLFSDWDHDGQNTDHDSDPQNSNVWSDWDHDGVNHENDTHPDNASLWSDWDSDGYNAENDTHPHDIARWNDQDNDGINDSPPPPPPPPPVDSDGDGYEDQNDTDPFNYQLWEDYNRNGLNDSIENSSEIDSDGDYVNNAYDSHKTNWSFWSDWDNDGLNSEDELVPGDDPVWVNSYSDPNIRDTDGDGVIDGQEKQFGTHPRKIDTDEDNATDYEELSSSLASNPLNPYSVSQRNGWGNLYLDGTLWNAQDSDADGIPDLVELLYVPGLNPHDASDRYYDLDGDGISNLTEYLAGTRLDGNTEIFDADGDGITDIKEDLYAAILDKNDSSDAVQDADGDGLLNFEETKVGLNPMDPDSFDGIPGALGLVFGHWAPATDSQGQVIPNRHTFAPGDQDSPDMQWLKSHVHSWWQMPLLKGDVDGDGMTDAWEHQYRLNVRKAADAGLDEEPDGLTNIVEFRMGTHPLLINTQPGQSDYGQLHGIEIGADTVHGSTSMYSPSGSIGTLPENSFGSYGVRDTRRFGSDGSGSSLQTTYQYSVMTSSHTVDGENNSWELGPYDMTPTGDGYLSGSYSSTPEFEPPGPDPISGLPNCGCISGDTRLSFCGCTRTTWTEVKEEDVVVGYTEHVDHNCQCGIPLANTEGPEEPDEWYLEKMRIEITRNQEVPRTEPDPEIYGFIVEEQDIGGGGDWSWVESFEITINQGDSTGSYITSTAPRGKMRRCLLIDGTAQWVDNPVSSSLSVKDIAGPRYRKVSLNGQPIPDSKPQMQDESGQQPEETYVDAYTLQLRHSVTDVYASAESTLLPLSVRRDYSPECYSNVSGLHNQERPDLPFGSGWRSNICSFIRIKQRRNDREAFVSDETGAVQNYIYKDNAWQRNYDENADAKTRFDTLIESGYFQLRKKFGTVCTYQEVSLQQTVGNDRANGSTKFDNFFYARLVSVQDRWKNELKYEYGHPTTLVPSRIYDPKRPDQQMLIRQQNGLVTEVRGPDGATTRYHYALAGLAGTASGPTSSMTDKTAPVLIGVSHVGADIGGEDACIGGLMTLPPGGPLNFYSQLPEGSVKYRYRLTGEEDTNPHDPLRLVHPYYTHIELSGIEDELGHRYEFSAYPDLSQRFLVRGPGGGWRTQHGLPMLLHEIHMPDGKDVLFDGGTRTMKVNNGEIETGDSPIVTSIKGPAGHFSYTFTAPIQFEPPGNDEAVSDKDHTTVHMAFQQMAIKTHTDPQLPAGVQQSEKAETFSFNVHASMALASVTDMSGKQTFFYYTMNQVPVETRNLINWTEMDTSASNSTADGQLYNDPIVEVDALGNFKTFTYTRAHRLLESVTDSRGVKTTYDIDFFGRRTKETVSGPFAGGRVTETFYDNLDFKGFATKTVTDGVMADNMPATVVKYDPDANGRIKVQLTGEMRPNGIFRELSQEETAYDRAGRKRSSKDGRGLITNFNYDALGRLEAVVHPDGSSKIMEYDDRGNLEVEVNENGVKTFHEYDVFNRRTKSIVNMDGDNQKDASYSTMTLPVAPAVEPSFNGDLVTSTSYTPSGQVRSTTDARGKVTTHQYDNLGRLLKTDDGGFITTFGYDPLKFGGSVFDSSSFKPNSVIDPRGVEAKTVYDDLYRAIEKRVVGIGGVTTTTYDKAGNPKTVTDPLGRVTQFVYDVDGKVVETTFADMTKVKASYTHAGKLWKQTNELNEITLIHYDGAGRPQKMIQPAVDGVSPVSETSYDKAGNAVMAKDPLGRISLTEYDNRNRPWKVTAPPVWDAIEGAYSRPITETAYDHLGQVVLQRDPMHRESLNLYDPVGRPWKVVNALGHAVLSTYDANGNVRTVTQKVTNANAALVDQTVINDYDVHNRLMKTVDGQGIGNEFEYDKVGNRTLVQDGLKQKTHFTYDEMGRLKTQKFANEDTWTFFYNAVHKTSQKDAAGVFTEYGYDQRSRLKTVTSPDLQRTYGYDDAGRLLSVTEAGHAESNVGYSYDELGRVETETSRGVTHTYHYDLAGNRILAELGTGRKIRTVPDALNRPEMILEAEGSLETMTAEARATSYGYDLSGRAVLLTTANGQVTENVYDELGRLTNRTLFKRMSDRSDAGVLAEFGWAYDEIGNVTAQHETWPGSAERDPQVRVTAMTYDLSNRLKTETVSQAVTGVVTTTYHYDGANNRKSKTVTGGAEPGHWTYDYNPANQLTAWYTHDSSAVKPEKRTSLTYDAKGNRATQEKGTLTADPDVHAQLLSQGISYQAVDAGPDGEDLTISLNANESGQDLAVNVVGGKHVEIDLSVEEAMPDSLTNQGITYATVTPHEEGREISVSLMAEAPLQESAVEVTGNDIVVKLATDGGTKATATHQGLAFAAADAGPAGNSFSWRFEDGVPGQPLDALLLGNKAVVKLAVDRGSAHTLTNQGITYTTFAPHYAEKEVAVSLFNDGPGQVAGVEVSGDDIKVRLATNEGTQASAADQGLIYTAIAPGLDGNQREVWLRRGRPGDDLSATLNGNVLQVDLETEGGSKAVLAHPGIAYEAAEVGSSFNGVEVSHVVDGPGSETYITVDGRRVIVHIGTSPGDHATGDVGSLTFTANQPGPAGNQIYIYIFTAGVPDSPLHVETLGQAIYAYLASDSQGNPSSTVADLVMALPGDLVSVSGDTGSAQIIDSSTSLSLTGGGENYEVTGTGNDVSAALTVHGEASQLVRIASQAGTVLESGTGYLDNGVDADIVSTVADVLDLLEDHADISQVVTVTGTASAQLMETSRLSMTGGGEDHVVTTTASQLVALLNGSQSLIAATGSGDVPLASLQSTVLTGGRDPERTSTQTQVIELLEDHPTISPLITVTGAGGEEIVQPASFELAGGGEDYAVTSTANDIVELLEGNGLITASGSGESVLTPLARTALSGSTPEILSKVEDIVSLLSATPAVTALMSVSLSSGSSGETRMQPQGPLALNGVTTASLQTTTSYTWTSENRLSGVTQPDGKSSGYRYDYRMRRVGTRSTSGGTDTHTAILFSGGLSTAEYESSTLQTTLANASAGLVHYVRGPDMGGGVGGLLYSLRTETGGSKKVRYNLSNGRGDIVAQSDVNAALTWTASYEAYGKRTQETGTNADKQRANSKDEDPTGLLNEGFRYRDIETGVWLSRDPAGFVDGPNLYAYVKQNPWTSFDPDGLKTKNDYRNDMKQAAAERAAEYKKFPANASGRATFGIENRYRNKVVKAQQGINNITETARATEYFTRQETGSVNDEFLDDEQSEYQTFNALRATGAILPLKFGEHVHHGEKGEAAKELAKFAAMNLALYGAGKGLQLLVKGGVPAASVPAARNLNIYEVLFEAPIKGTTRGTHRTSANRFLFRDLSDDPALAGMMDQELGANVLQHMKSGKGLLNPPGTVWHHPDEAGNVMRLLRIGEHTNPVLQPVLHPGPNGIGGFGKFYGP